MGLVRERLLGDAAGAADWYERFRARGGSEELLATRRTGRRPDPASGPSRGGGG
jgi:hypothetical protein